MKHASLMAAMAAAALFFTACDSEALHHERTATAHMKDPEGNTHGTVALTQTPHGVLLTAKLENMPAGTHAFHIHETGACSPDFSAAGGHYNPDGVAHGLLNPGGAHAGDLPNIHVPESGALTLEVLTANVSLEEHAGNTLFDADGSAIVIHDGADDYITDPAGAAGVRIACGVIEAG